MRKHKKTWLALAFIFPVLLIVIVSVIILNSNTNNVGKRIENYCQDKKEISLSSVTNFSWDTAYIDNQSYGYGENIKKKYGLKGNLERLDSDYLYRIIFCKNKVIVHDEILSIHNIVFEQSVEVIEPSTIFLTEWKPQSDGSKILYFTLKT